MKKATLNKSSNPAIMRNVNPKVDFILSALNCEKSGCNAYTTIPDVIINKNVPVRTKKLNGFTLPAF